MGFLKVNQEDVAASGASNYIKVSGIYDIKIKACEVATTKGGSTQVNYYTDRTNIFGQIVATKEGKNTDKNGKKLSGYGVVEALAVVLGTVNEDSEPGFCDPEEISVKFSKGPKDLLCLDQATDMAVKAWIQFEYQMYNGKIQERINLKRFYRNEDGASGSEISAGLIAAKAGTKVAANMAPGTQFEKDESKGYALETKYSDSAFGAGDAPTAEDVAAWQKAQASGAGAAATPSAPKTATNNPFAKK